MKKSNPLQISGNSFAALYRFVDYAILAVSLPWSIWLYNALFDSQSSFNQHYLILLLSEILLFSYLAEAFSLYRDWKHSAWRRMLQTIMLVLCLTFIAIPVLLFFVKEGSSFSRVILLIWFATSSALMLGWRLAKKRLRQAQIKHGAHLQRVAIVGLTERGSQLFEEFKLQQDDGFVCVGFFDDRSADRVPAAHRDLLLGTVNQAVALGQAGEFSRLYICLPLHAEQRIQHIIGQLGDTTLDVYLVPDLLTMKMMQGRLSSVGDIDTISVFESPHLGLQRYLKRTFDVIFSAAALIFLFPLFILIALAIKLTSRGPVFFRQDRYGLDGRKIGVLKFRSMKVLENDAVVVQATRHDPRVTTVGQFLRRTSLDELPQFVNVLLGDMSVVGPRPHAVAHNEQYRNQVAFYMLRHKVKPGITGWAQINGWRGETDTLDKMAKRVEFDLYYIRHWSLWLDIKIVIKTVLKGFSGQHVY